MQDMTGKTVLITGASRGIGADTARWFTRAGANVALLARGADEILELAASIGSKAMAIPCDVSDYKAVSAAVSQTVSPVCCAVAPLGSPTWYVALKQSIECH